MFHNHRHNIANNVWIVHTNNDTTRQFHFHHRAPRRGRVPLNSLTRRRLQQHKPRRTQFTRLLPLFVVLLRFLFPLPLMPRPMLLPNTPGFS